MARNDLTGEATFVTAGEDLDAAQCNAISVPATEVSDGDDTLCLGDTEPTEEYPEPEHSGPPNVLVLDHLFDSLEPRAGDAVFTFIDLVPCNEDLLDQAKSETRFQFLVFCEDEQRFSTSHRANCLFETRLSATDTRPGVADDSFPIFTAAVQGSAAGQTRIRPLLTTEPNVGYTRRASELKPT